VLGDVSGFERRIARAEVAPRVLVSVGSKEQDVPNPLPPQLTDAVRNKMPKIPLAITNLIAKIAVKKMMLNWRMVDNARSLATQLQRIKGGRGYCVRFHAFDDEDHLTALAASIARALSFSLNP
jgi:hypothetical protein